MIAEEQTFTKESNLEPAELENGQFSIPERNREPLTIDTQDLNSILKSLDGNFFPYRASFSFFNLFS